MMAVNDRQNGNTVQVGGAQRTVLVCGASFAGLATAWWMRRLGYAVTVVEMANGLRKGGTPVDIREDVVDVVRRMGLLERIAAKSLPARPTAFLNEEGVALAHMPAEIAGEAQGEGEEQGPQEEYEIERDDLLDILYDELEGGAEFRFGDSIASVEEREDEVAVTFTSGEKRSYSLLFGCDGTHSAVRRMCFGEEARYLKFLHCYFSLTIVNKLLLAENTSQLFSVPGRTIMLNAYHGKTDIGLAFHAEETVSYDRRDREEQRRMIEAKFAQNGWRTGELLEEMRGCDDFYFDMLCQIRMPAWTKSRVALVGDAGYCPSPAAGMGGSMAILGAAALGEAFAEFPEDHRRAFAAYDERLRPVVERIQREAAEVGLPMFLPQTQEAIEKRNAQLGLGVDEPAAREG